MVAHLFTEYHNFLSFNYIIFEVTDPGKLLKMKRIICLFLLSGAIAVYTLAQQTQKGPYTVTVLADGVYHIEDANDSNPAGLHLDENGETTGMNNCSDMYLVVGKDKALLIDLSNAITWDSTATESLRSLVFERVGPSKLYVTVTHRHGDHLGMLPAFVDDPKANFWIPEAEFDGMDVFPEDRTTYFSEGESFDLGGGLLINTLEVPGHTAHSTIFFFIAETLVWN